MADLNPDLLSEEIFQALEEFAAVQQRHFASLAAGQLEDSHHWRHERQQAFAALQARLDWLATHPEGVAGPGARSRLLQRVQEVLAGEAGLREKVVARREALAARLQAVRKGRVALKGYTTGEAGRGSRFLSSRS